MTETMPSRLRIGFRDFRIVEWDHAEAVGAEMHGQIAYSEQTIRVDPHYGPVQTAETLIHEILHGINDQWRAVPRKREEHAVTQFAHGLAVVLRDNPDLRRFLVEAFDA